MVEEIKNIVNEEIMLERGKFVANGYTFTVRPVYLGEEDEYLSEMTVSPIPIEKEGEKIDQDDDKKMSQWSIALFSESLNGVKKRKKGRFYNFLCWLFRRRDYHYYSDVPAIQPLIKWIERKVTCNGKKIRFYDLERKYGLSKAEIERLFIYFHELSGF